MTIADHKLIGSSILHISKGLAERQGGKLWLEASSSAGSVFVLELVLSRHDGTVMTRHA